MTSCHLILTWHEWNVNADDVMMMWFTLYANLVTSHLAYAMCMHMHGTHTLYRNSKYKYLSDLACMQAISNLMKITAAYFQVLSTQSVN